MDIHMHESQTLLKFSSYTQKLVLQITICKGKKSERTEIVVIFLTIGHDSSNIQGKCALFQLAMKLMKTDRLPIHGNNVGVCRQIDG